MSKRQRIVELEGLCSEMYQIFGSMAIDLGLEKTKAFENVMDKLSAAQNGLDIPDIELLPFDSHNIIMDEGKHINPWGYHAIYDGHAGDKAVITNGDCLKTFARMMVEKIGMKAYGEPEIDHFATHDPAKAGYTLIQKIETSDITGHFCDSTGDFYLDIFSCKPFDLRVATQFIKEYFKPKALESRFIFRQAPDYDQE